MNKQKIIRLSIMVFILLCLLLIGKYSGFGDWFKMDNIVAMILSFGIWGYFIFTVMIVIGSFIHLPVFLFVLAAIITYGQIEGTMLGFVGVLVAALANFMFSRLFGGRETIGEVGNKFLRKYLYKLQVRPIFTMVVIRFFMWGSPLINFSLGLTKMKTTHFIVGSALGLIIPFIIFSAAVFFFREHVFSFVGG